MNLRNDENGVAGRGDLRALVILRQRVEHDRDAGIPFRDCADRLFCLRHVRGSRPRPLSPGAMRCRPPAPPLQATTPRQAAARAPTERTPRDAPILMENFLAAVTASVHVLI